MSTLDLLADATADLLVILALRALQKRRSWARKKRVCVALAAIELMRCRQRRLYTLRGPGGLLEQLASAGDDEFRRHLRLPKDAVIFICELFPSPENHRAVLDAAASGDQAGWMAARGRGRRGRPSFTVFLRVCVALWRMATQGSYRDLSALFGLPESTVVTFCDEFFAKLSQKETVKTFIRYRTFLFLWRVDLGGFSRGVLCRFPHPDQPTCEADARDIIQGFRSITKLAQVVNIMGALDSTSIELFQHFPGQPTATFDRKSNHSIKLQAICDAHEIFTDVSRRLSSYA